jgi:hypothetical protein
MSDDDEQDTVLVFPDYTIVADISRTREGAHRLWETVVDPNVERGDAIYQKTPFKTWVLPYSSIILLCRSEFCQRGDSFISILGSHKRRDNRCAIAAPKLEQGSSHSFRTTDLSY